MPQEVGNRLTLLPRMTKAQLLALWKERFRVRGKTLFQSFPSRSLDHRDALVWTALLRPQNQSPQGAYRCAAKLNLASAVRSIPANPPKKDWSNPSTRSMPNGKLAGPS